MDFQFFSKNGEIRPIEEAVVALSNIEYQYGFGVYENIRVHEGVPYFLQDHLERLTESARIIGLEHAFDEALVKKSVDALIEKSGASTYNLKILLLGALAKEDASLYILPLNPHFPDKKLYRHGADFITYEYQRPFPHAKSLNMLESYLAFKKAREARAYDALLINDMGCITEGTRTNFFCLQGKTIVTPPEDEILLGVMRKAVLQSAVENGFIIEEREISFGELESSDGAFVTSTSSKILPIRRVDSFVYQEIPVELKGLMTAFDSFLAHWKRDLA